MIKKKHEKEHEELENEVVLASAEQQTEEPNNNEQPQTKQKETESKVLPELSETDILKLYLEQSINEMKKAKKGAEDAKKELEEAKSQALQLKEKLASIMTEYENYRHRTTEEKESIYAEAVCKSASVLLPVLDSLELAMPFADSNPQSFKRGVQMTLTQLIDGFATLGIEEIVANECKFNPNVHNAVMHVEDESHNESTITEVFQKGFKYGDKVIRHSIVKVAN